MTHPGSTSAEPLWFLGSQARILVPGAATGGAISVMEFRLLDLAWPAQVVRECAALVVSPV